MFRTLDCCLFPTDKVSWDIRKLYEGKAEGIIDIPFNFFDEVDRILMYDFVKANIKESLYLFENNLEEIMKNVERIPPGLFERIVNALALNYSNLFSRMAEYRNIPLSYLIPILNHINLKNNNSLSLVKLLQLAYTDKYTFDDRIFYLPTVVGNETDDSLIRDFVSRTENELFSLPESSDNDILVVRYFQIVEDNVEYRHFNYKNRRINPYFFDEDDDTFDTRSDIEEYGFKTELIDGGPAFIVL